MEASMGACHVLYMTESLFYTDIFQPALLILIVGDSDYAQASGAHTGKSSTLVSSLQTD